MGIDFTKVSHVLINPLVEYLLCSPRKRPVLLCKSYLLEPQHFRKFQAPGHSSGEVQSADLNNRSTGVADL